MKYERQIRNVLNAASSGINGEIHDPTSEEMAKARVRAADERLKKLIPQEGLIWKAPGK